MRDGKTPEEESQCKQKFDLWLNLKAIYDDYYDDSDLRDFPPSPPKTKRRKRARQASMLA